MYKLGKLLRFSGDSYHQKVEGGHVGKHGTAAYFVTLQQHRSGVPFFRVSYCDGGGDLAVAGLQRNGVWRELGDELLLMKARRVVRQHFDATFGELNKKEKP